MSDRQTAAVSHQDKNNQDTDENPTMSTTDDSDDSTEEHTVTVYDEVQDVEALASTLHRLTNALRRADVIDHDDRQALYGRIEDALGREMPYDEAPEDAK